MSAGANQLDLIEASKATERRGSSDLEKKQSEKGLHTKENKTHSHYDSTDESQPEVLVGPNGEQYPTQEEARTLRRVCGKIPWVAWTIAFVELCERFSYYGTTAVFVNFIQQDLPAGSDTGAVGTFGQPGALGMGQRASTGLTLFNSFWAYLMPIVGAYIADTYLGRYKTILWSILIAIIGHLFILIASIPPLIVHPNAAIAIFAIGLVIFGVGTGGFKSNISPLIAEQYEAKEPRARIMTLQSGERVIIDPSLTVSRIYMYFYMMINIGALIGQIGMVFAERYVGFYLAFLLPTIMFIIAPIVMFVFGKQYHKRPPTGSVLGKTFKLVSLGFKESKKAKKRSDGSAQQGFFERVKPSHLQSRPSWMTFDDAWVDEVRRGLLACRVFLWYPLYWLAYSQMLNNLISQAATMETHGTPNDIINNIDPIALVIFIPIFDQVVYPFLARHGYRFTPLKRITAGFLLASLSMVVAAVIQNYVYKYSPCGNYANSCLDADGELRPATINVWIQVPAYLLIAFSEIFASITGLEYAFTKAPKNMRSLVMSIFLFQNAISSAISQAFVSLSADPLLVWLYTTVAILAFLGGVGFWFAHKDLDKQEDVLNALPESEYKGRGKSRQSIDFEKGGH